MVIGMLIAVSFTLIVSLIEPQFPSFLRYGYLKKIIIWSWLLLVYLYTAGVEKQDFFLWKDSRHSILFYCISVITIAVLSFLARSSQQLLPGIGLNVQRSQLLHQMLSYLHTHFFLLVLTCITAAVVEELIFRAYLIPRLSMLLRDAYLPVIISALFFGLAHIGYGTLINMFVPFLLGLIFGAYYQKYRNIKVLIICHFLLDLTSLLFAK